MKGPMFAIDDKSISLDLFITESIQVCQKKYFINPTRILVNHSILPKIDQTKFTFITFQAVGFVFPNNIWIGE
jgi:hypothetical protein